MTAQNEPSSSHLSASSLSVCPQVDVVVEKDCFWVHNILTIKEQIQVFEDILERSKNVDNTQKRPCMNPSPKTLLFDGHKSTLCFRKKRENNDDFESDETPASMSSVYDELILRRVSSLVAEHVGEKERNGAMPGLQYDRYSVGVIRYAAPNGIFPEHIDHCNDANGWVFLMSLGCTARFSVQKKPPKTNRINAAVANAINVVETNKEVLELKSGDVLVFDPSTEAAILHGVNSIIPSTCPGALVQAFGEEAMANHRYGVQCRTSVE